MHWYAHLELSKRVIYAMILCILYQNPWTWAGNPIKKIKRTADSRYVDFRDVPCGTPYRFFPSKCGVKGSCEVWIQRSLWLLWFLFDQQIRLWLIQGNCRKINRTMQILVCGRGSKLVEPQWNPRMHLYASAMFGIQSQRSMLRYQHPWCRPNPVINQMIQNVLLTLAFRCAVLFYRSVDGI